jgi:anti-anti-sigma factor
MILQSSNGLLEVEKREDVIIARFPRQVSLCGQMAEGVSEGLASLLSEPGQQRLLVDFENVQSLTSFMLGQLVKLNRTAESSGRRLALFNLSPYIRQTLEVSRLTILLSLFEDESAALRASAPE